jgi:hypothetical protein
MAADLRGDLEHDELAGPGGEPALSPELVELGDDRDQGVVGRLVGDVLEFGPRTLSIARRR